MDHKQAGRPGLYRSGPDLRATGVYAPISLGVRRLALVSLPVLLL